MAVDFTTADNGGWLEPYRSNKVGLETLESKNWHNDPGEIHFISKVGDITRAREEKLGRPDFGGC